MTDFEKYINGKTFYTYGEDTEVFFSKGEEELYSTYFCEEFEDIEDFPVQMISDKNFLKTSITSECRYSEDDLKNEDGTYKVKVLKILQLAAKEGWKTPWQLSSNYG